MSVTAVPIKPVKAGYLAWLWLGIVAAIVAAFALAVVGVSPIRVASYSPEDFLAWNANQSGIKTTSSGLQYKVIEAGSGDAPKKGDGVSMKIKGTLRDGTVFQPEAPYRTMVGSGQTIPGFDEAAGLVPKGGHYRFWLPPKLGYGEAASGKAESLAGKVLIFDITTDDIVPASVIQQMMMQQMLQGGAGGAGGAGAGGAGSGK